MHPWVGRAFKSVENHIDIVSLSACQRRYRAITDFTGYGTHAFQISMRSDRKAGLNDIHAE